MYGYGSTTYAGYGSYSSITSPRDILSPSSGSTRSSYSCAFPSWPRRSSLSEADSDPDRASAYLSDEDLDWTFTASAASDPFEDSDSHSVSSSSTEGGINTSPRLAAADTVTAVAPQITDADAEELERERAAYQREVMRFLLNEKERRRQQAAMARKSMRSTSSSRDRHHSSNSDSKGAPTTTKPSSSAKKSPRSKLSAMTPIAEAE